MHTRYLINCNNAIFAEEIKEKLSEQGIFSLIKESSNPLGTTINHDAVGYVIMVDENKYEKARIIVEELEKVRNSNEPLWCPYCEGEDISGPVEKKSHSSSAVVLMSTIIILIAGLLMFYVESIVIPIIAIALVALTIIIGVKEKIYHCNKCGKDFKHS